MKPYMQMLPFGSIFNLIMPPFGNIVNKRVILCVGKE